MCRCFPEFVAGEYVHPSLTKVAESLGALLDHAPLSTGRIVAEGIQLPKIAKIYRISELPQKLPDIRLERRSSRNDASDRKLPPRSVGA